MRPMQCSMGFLYWLYNRRSVPCQCLNEALLGYELDTRPWHSLIVDYEAREEQGSPCVGSLTGDAMSTLGGMILGSSADPSRGSVREFIMGNCLKSSTADDVSLLGAASTIHHSSSTSGPHNTPSGASGGGGGPGRHRDLQLGDEAHGNVGVCPT